VAQFDIQNMYTNERHLEQTLLYCVGIKSTLGYALHGRSSWESREAFNWAAVPM
jgi:hypothetical protein